MKLSEKLAAAEKRANGFHFAVTAIANGQPIRWTEWVQWHGRGETEWLVRYGLIGDGFRAIKACKRLQDQDSRSAYVTIVAGEGWGSEPGLLLTQVGLVSHSLEYLKPAPGA